MFVGAAREEPDISGNEVVCPGRAAMEGGMTAVSAELENTLRQLDPASANSLERVV